MKSNYIKPCINLIEMNEVTMAAASVRLTDTNADSSGPVLSKRNVFVMQEEEMTDLVLEHYSVWDDELK